MRNILAVILFIVPIFAGCASNAVRPTIKDTEVANVSFDKTWGAIVATLSEKSYPIQTVDKASGLITTQLVVFADGIMAQNEIDRIAVRPSGFLYTWSGGRYSINVYAVQIDSNRTRIKITTHIEAFENNVTHQWMVCYSNGQIEAELFNAIKMKTNLM